MSTTDEPESTAAEPDGAESEGAAAETAAAEAVDEPGAEAERSAVETEEPATSTGLSRFRSRRVLLAAVGAAYIAVFGTVGGLGWVLWQQHQVASAGAAGQNAADEFARTLTSIDSGNVDNDFDAVLNGSTGEFKDTYTKASVQLRQLLIDNKATAKGEVVASAVQSEAKNKVVVLVMVNQTITNTARPDPRVDRSRMKMTMEKVDGRWLASKVELP